MTSASHVAPRPASNYRRARRVNDACDALQISRSHLYALAAAGKIKLIRIGGRTLVPEAEIDRLAEEGARAMRLSAVSAYETDWPG